MLPDSPEQLTEFLHFKITPSMKQAINDYAQKHQVGQAVAVRHMIAHFLQNDFIKSEVHYSRAEGEKAL